MTDHIKLTEQDGVLEICFARPDKKNALTNAMYVAASSALEAAQSNDAVRVVMFSAEGGAFTAGNDLSEFAAIANGESVQSQAHLLIQALARASKPIVAAVPGLAVGVGTTMLLHCDLVYVAETAKLSTPFVNLGLAPEAGSSYLMPARIGHLRAFAMFALGESVSGAEAVMLGLANKAYPSDKVRDEALAAAKLLASKPTGSVMTTKKLMRELPALLAKLDVEGAAFRERLTSDEARQAFAAFLNRK